MDSDKKDKKRYANFGFSKPAIHQIKVLGEMNQDWADKLQGMQITIDRTADSEPISILNGRIIDQSALSGVLNTLYDMHLTVISVKLLA